MHLYFGSVGVRGSIFWLGEGECTFFLGEQWWLEIYFG